MLSPLLIRADAGARRGVGHVMRCLALAQGWQEAGGAAHFAVAEIPAALETRLADEAVAVTHIAAQAGSAADAAGVIALAKMLAARWVVLDGYHFDAAYAQAIKAAGLRLLCLDDYGHTDGFPADLTLNQNHLPPPPPLLGAGGGSLCGTRYALLRREFWPWRGWRREVRTEARRLLVTLGGGDPANLTQRVLEALESVALDGLEAVVVVGAANPRRDALEAAARRSRHTVHLADNITDMPARMAWADTALAAAGSTCWELAFMGLPSLLVSVADNQRPLAQGMDAAGAARDLGGHEDVTPEQIAEGLNRLLADVDARTAMARRGPLLVDGNGPQRVVAALRAASLSLRPAREDDCRRLWAWASDPDVRAASFSSEPIPWAAHAAWFAARLDDPDCDLLVAIDEDETPVGQVRFDREGAAAVISIGLDRAARGKGYGSRIIARATREYLARRPAVRRVYAYIKPENTASQRAFIRAGYAEAAPTTVRGCPAARYIGERGNQ